MKQKLHIDMETVPISKHRYTTIDDFKDPKSKGNNLLFHITVGDMKNTDYEFLVMIHALIENYLCFRRGIKDKAITGFDIAHPEGNELDGGPGDLKDAPYHKEHMVATDIESQLSVELDVDWISYSKCIDKMLKEWRKKK